MLAGAHGLGDGKLHGNERAVAVKLPIPQSFLAGPLNITVRGTSPEGPSSVRLPPTTLQATGDGLSSTRWRRTRATAMEQPISDAIRCPRESGNRNSSEDD